MSFTLNAKATDAVERLSRRLGVNQGQVLRMGLQGLATQYREQEIMDLLHDDDCVCEEKTAEQIEQDKEHEKANNETPPRGTFNADAAPDASPGKTTADSKDKGKGGKHR